MSKKTCRHHQRYLVWVTITFLTISAHICLLPALAAGQQAALAELSLEELMDVEVTSASRKPQRAGDVAAAVFVITQDDIRRSGATSVREVLRMAPGVEVARIDSNKWAVTARGFNGRFANKLLVLLDGRSMYTRLFSGVFWDTLETDLADIERIEVIRGPGAAVWGANAVNGVINIITKPATETQGVTASVGAGGEERGFGSVRYGGEFGESQGHYRIYGKYLNRDAGVNAFTGQPSGDAWDSSRAGFQLDYASSPSDSLTIHGGAYNGSSGETVLTRLPDSILRAAPAQRSTGCGWQRAGSLGTRIQRSRECVSPGLLLPRGPRDRAVPGNPIDCRLRAAAASTDWRTARRGVGWRLREHPR